MFRGLIVGIVIGCMVGGFIGSIIYDISNHYYTLKGWLSGLLICIVITIGCGTIGRYKNITYAESYIAKYNICKTTYVSSLSDESLSGLERIQSVKDIANLNKSLANYKVNIDKIWNFDIPKNLKKQIKNLEYIKIQ